MAIKAVIFDMGGVLLDAVNYKYFRKMEGITNTSEKTIRDFIVSLLVRYESGSMTKHEFDSRIARRFGIKESEVNWPIFLYDNGKVKKEMVSLAKKLSKRYKVACITNVDKSRYYYAKSLIDYSIFRFVLASCYFGRSKPDKRIYLEALRRLNVKPSEAIFIDDMEVNVKGARKVGITAIHFKGINGLIRDLKRYGIDA
jgi:epoxide hydrolase-like predicted phosphatase